MNDMHQQRKEREEKQETVKAVMFVPYTVGSELAKIMRDAGSKIQEMTGYRLKIVERAGLKLEDLLHRAEPGLWQRQVPALSDQAENRQAVHKDFYWHSLVYETWCMTCERDKEAVKMQAGDDKNKHKMLMDNIKIRKYMEVPQ